MKYFILLLLTSLLIGCSNYYNLNEGFVKSKIKINTTVNTFKIINNEITINKPTQYILVIDHLGNYNKWIVDENTYNNAYLGIFIYIPLKTSILIKNDMINIGKINE
jgi:hypothetical protein